MTSAENRADTVIEQAAKVMRANRIASDPGVGIDAYLAWEQCGYFGRKPYIDHARALSEAGLLATPADQDESPHTYTQWFHALADALDRAERAEAEVAELRATVARARPALPAASRSAKATCRDMRGHTVDNEVIEQATKVLVEHRLQYDNTGGHRGILGGWNRYCICGWHGVDHEPSDRVFEHHVAEQVSGLLATPADQDGTTQWQRANIAEVRAERAETERDQLRAQVAAVRALADEWRYRPHPEGAESVSDWTYRMHEQSLGSLLGLALDGGGQ